MYEFLTIASLATIIAMTVWTIRVSTRYHVQTMAEISRLLSAIKECHKMLEQSRIETSKLLHQQATLLNVIEALDRKLSDNRAEEEKSLTMIQQLITETDVNAKLAQSNSGQALEKVIEAANTVNELSGQLDGVEAQFNGVVGSVRTEINLNVLERKHTYLAIKQMKDEGLSTSEIAKKFGISTKEAGEILEEGARLYTVVS